VTAAGLVATRRGRGRRAWPGAVAAVLVLAGAASTVLWLGAEGEERVAAVDAVDASLASRVAVTVAGVGVVRDHPLVGTGLGSWLHAFRPYQAPPVDGGIWDHAHDDYLELAAETGVAGVGLALVFALAVVRAARRPTGTAVARRPRPPGFEPPEWRDALGELALLRWGLAGGVAALLVHSTLDFGLRMPANLLAFMLVLALLVLTGARSARGEKRALPALLATLVVAALPAVVDALGGALGTPLSPARCLAAADLALAETGDATRAARLARAALDRAPAAREAHEMLARALGPGRDGDAALGRAIALNPWSSELRDRLAFQLWARGERAAAADTLAESLRRVPYLAAHGFLGPDTTAPDDARQLVRVVVDGDTMPVRLAALDPAVADALERGLRQALDAAPAGEPRAAIVDDLVALLEARNRWADAAALLRDDADPGPDGAVRLAHAARDSVRAGDHAAAEQALLTALLRTPERGELYRLLAVDVYGARKEFETADRVLHAGQRSAVDILPVYEGVTQVLAQREAARFDEPVERAEP
jgi:thioredoxin-like negative regulator of GroEL